MWLCFALLRAVKGRRRPAASYSQHDIDCCCNLRILVEQQQLFQLISISIKRQGQTLFFDSNKLLDLHKIRFFLSVAAGAAINSNRIRKSLST